MPDDHASFPAESLMRWRRVDVPGHEEARIKGSPQGWHLTGELEVHEQEVGPGRLRYSIECDSRWHTRTAAVEGTMGGDSVRFSLTADGEGHWSQDGRSVASFTGALDVDLGFTPATNTLPIRRLALSVGASAVVRSAWLRFPELRLELLEQVYTRQAATVYRYVADVDGAPFTARLDTDAYGRVLRYEGLWEAQFAMPEVDMSGWNVSAIAAIKSGKAGEG